MPTVTFTVQTPIARTARVLQVEGLFDLSPSGRSELTWTATLPLDERPWHVGLIVGPSGCGKSTLARRLWPEQLAAQPAWPADRSILDAFPASLAIKEIVALLCAVGFSSPPAWLRPFHVLSTGQQFRAGLARLLAEQPELAVVDEFSSVVDRTVAQVGSHAVARAVRAREQRLVAVTCHEDVEPWLNPDWVFRPDANTFTWRLLQGRPAITLEICRIGREAWSLFKPHHYLSGDLAPAAVCFGAFWQERLVAFSAWIHSLTARGGKREHRTVTLPDYQGVGIGDTLSTFAASLWKGLACRATSTTTHPALIARRLRSSRWRLTRPPGLAQREGHGCSRLRHAQTRLTAGFEYVGPALDATSARLLLQGIGP
jgi:hypothetical protein